MSEVLGAKFDSFKVFSNEKILLHEVNPSFYHQNFFSSKDFFMMCEKHKLDGEIQFNSNNTLTFIMKIISG